MSLSAQNRECVEACVVSGFNIPKGVVVKIDILDLHMDPDLFGPIDPELFEPERWECSWRMWIYAALLS